MEYRSSASKVKEWRRLGTRSQEATHGKQVTWSTAAKADYHEQQQIIGGDDSGDYNGVGDDIDVGDGNVEEPLQVVNLDLDRFNVDAKCQGITLDFLATLKLHDFESVHNGFCHLVGAAMHQLGSAVSKQDKESAGLCNVPFPNQGTILNKTTQERTWLLVDYDMGVSDVVDGSEQDLNAAHASTERDGEVTSGDHFGF